MVTKLRHRDTTLSAVSRADNAMPYTTGKTYPASNPGACKRKKEKKEKEERKEPKPKEKAKKEPKQKKEKPEKPANK